MEQEMPTVTEALRAVGQGCWRSARDGPDLDWQIELLLVVFPVLIEC